MESVVFLRPTVLTIAIRRDILSVLAESDTMTMSAATAEIAAGWSTRRRRWGDSPSAVHTAEAIVFQVGADLLDEFARQPPPPLPARSESERPSRGEEREPVAGRPAPVRPSGKEA
jgi:hypothetical protein